ncbi:alpha/beta hydrolase [Streptococcus dentasini]
MEIQELWLKRDELSIYGKLYLPDSRQEKLPVIIMSHGFRATYLKNVNYAEMACNAGYAAYIFDFCGGSSQSQSDGLFTDMSVLTEADDLLAVIRHMQQDPRIDNQRIYLLGESQGGFVSAYLAGQIPEQVAGLILFYPAFVLQDDAAERQAKYGTGSQSRQVMGVSVGSIYNRDALSFDVYEEIAAYQRPVLIVHGDSDSIVPLVYSERAQKVYKQARLKVLLGAGHGFKADHALAAGQAMLDYLADLEQG